VNYTIDANVFISDAVPADVHHSDSRAFLTALGGRDEQIYCPSLVMVETAAAIARLTGNAALARRTANLIRRFPKLKLVSLTIARSRRAVELAALHRLRGADTVYLAVAEEHSTTLITWDTEMLARAAGVVTTMTPSQWLVAPP
jgi:predicted nucleic acid-binding protein